MNNNPRGRGSKYTDAFKSQLVAESRAAGTTVPMVAKQHEVPTGRIYSWRGDVRFQPATLEAPDFTPVEIADTPDLNAVDHLRPEPRIEITLKNGHKISISAGVDAGFVLELARGLAA